MYYYLVLTNIIHRYIYIYINLSTSYCLECLDNLTIDMTRRQAYVSSTYGAVVFFWKDSQIFPFI